MAKVFVIGAAGKIGRHLVQRLSERRHAVLALHRKPEQADDLAGLGATPVSGSLTDLSAGRLGEHMRGCDVAVFSAGAGGAGLALTQAIDGDGLELAVAAATHANVRRFLLVSAFPNAGREKERNEGFEAYIRIKKLADVHLVASDRDWVIVRPGTLLDEPGTGRVRADLAIPYGTIPREDVALALAELVDRPKIGRVIIELTRGDAPVGDALERLARR